MEILHTMVRVGNLDKSIRFYTEAMGMKLRRKKDYPGGKFTLAFVAYGDSGGHEIELTYNWDRSTYTMGDAFGHIAVKTDDIYKMADHIKALGGKIVREPGPMKHGTTVIAFAEDPDGYKIELIQK
ncbi:MAG: lactoylglutathione lyase [Deltaproteobacteria bacterium]|nr:lactoylglutathione lyase [Deltaproteobacteria bacterium]